MTGKVDDNRDLNGSTIFYDHSTAADKVQEAKNRALNQLVAAQALIIFATVFVPFCALPWSLSSYVITIALPVVEGLYFLFRDKPPPPPSASTSRASSEAGDDRDAGLDGETVSEGGPDVDPITPAMSDTESEPGDS